MKKAEISIENLELAVKSATTDAEIALKIFDIREKRLKEKIQTLLETELTHFKEYKCKVFLNVNLGIVGHTNTSIIIDVPIPGTANCSPTSINVKIIFNRGENYKKIIDINTGTIMDNLVDVPEKYRASIIAGELAVAYNKQKLFIKKIEELMYNFKKYPIEVAKANQKVKKNLKKNFLWLKNMQSQQNG